MFDGAVQVHANIRNSSDINMVNQAARANREFIYTRFYVDFRMGTIAAFDMLSVQFR